MTDEIEVYRGDDGQWYWRRTAPNGRKISAGGEGFTRRWSARRAAVRANPDRDRWSWAD